MGRKYKIQMEMVYFMWWVVKVMKQLLNYMLMMEMIMLINIKLYLMLMDILPYKTTQQDLIKTS